MDSDDTNSQIHKQIQETLNSSSSSFGQTQQEPSYQIKAMMQLIQSFKKDR